MVQSRRTVDITPAIADYAPKHMESRLKDLVRYAVEKHPWRVSGVFLAATIAINVGVVSYYVQTAKTAEVPYPYAAQVVKEAQSVGLTSPGVTEEPCRDAAGCQPVTIDTKELVGYAKIDRINVVRDLTAKAKWELAGKHIASLQLNAMLRVTYLSYTPNHDELFVTSKNYEYFIQNVAQLNTAKNTVDFVSSVWPALSYNFTATEAVGTMFWPQISSPLIKGNGYVNAGYQTRSGPVDNYYQFTTGEVKYTDPFSLYLTMNLSTTGGREILQFGYVLQKGSESETGRMYDTVKIRIPAKGNLYLADIEVGTYQVFADEWSQYHEVAQLVFGGPDSSDIAMLSKTSVPQIAIYFRNPNGTYTPFNVYAGPNSGEVGTGETAVGIKVTRPQMSYPSVSDGMQQTGPCESSCPIVSNPPLAGLLRDGGARLPNAG